METSQKKTLNESSEKKKNHYSIQISDLPQNSMTPCLSLCRKLLKGGYSPDTSITFLRGTQHAVLVPSIGDAAKLGVRDNKFVKYRKYGQ